MDVLSEYVVSVLVSLLITCVINPFSNIMYVTDLNLTPAL